MAQPAATSGALRDHGETVAGFTAESWDDIVDHLATVACEGNTKIEEWAHYSCGNHARNGYVGRYHEWSVSGTSADVAQEISELNEDDPTTTAETR
jgi:hypothetical protein